TTTVFVTIKPTPEVPGWPVFGILIPLSAGWLRTTSGVSPCATRHVISPRSRLIAANVPYGGFTIGSPCTFRVERAGGGSAGELPPCGLARSEERRVGKEGGCVAGM